MKKTINRNNNKGGGTSHETGSGPQFVPLDPGEVWMHLDALRELGTPGRFVALVRRLLEGNPRQRITAIDFHHGLLGAQPETVAWEFAQIDALMRKHNINAAMEKMRVSNNFGSMKDL